MLTTIIFSIIAAICIYVAWMLWEIKHATHCPDECEKPHTETICGECGDDCPGNGCDKSCCHAHKPEDITSDHFIKKEKERIVTEDEIRYTAYLLASEDNFTKRPEIYWTEAEKQLKGYNNHG